MQVKRVLVRWVPSQQLRDERFLLVGADFTSEVQQLGVEMHHPEFARAMVLAQSSQAGFPVLTVGFDVATRYTGAGFVFCAPPQDGEIWKRWDYQPSRADLLAYQVAHLGGLTEEQEIRAQRIEALVLRLRHEHNVAVAAEVERLRVRTPAEDAEFDEATLSPIHQAAGPGGPAKPQG